MSFLFWCPHNLFRNRPRACLGRRGPRHILGPHNLFRNCPEQTCVPSLEPWALRGRHDLGPHNLFETALEPWALRGGHDLDTRGPHSLFDIGQNVVDVLDSDRHADEIPGEDELLGGDGGVGEGAGHLDDAAAPSK